MLLKRLNCGNRKEIHALWCDEWCVFSSLPFSAKIQPTNKTTTQRPRTYSDVSLSERRETTWWIFSHWNSIYMQKCCYVLISSVYSSHFPWFFFLAHSFLSNGTKNVQLTRVTEQRAVFSIYEVFLIKLDWTEAKRIERDDFPDAFRCLKKNINNKTHTHKSNEHIKTVKQRKINYLLEMEHRNKEIIWYFRIIRLNKGKIMWP